MIKDYFKELILQNFGFPPTIQQSEVIDSLVDFILSTDADSVFVLRGFAGTGKTSLVSALVKTMEQLEKDCVLMAPTGRAAKVFSLYADHPAFTIHKRIYRQKSIDKDSIFSLNFNMRQNLLFICDEASMIANDEYSGGSMYGTGRLLDDMIHFVYGGKGCRLIIMGDTAQLPPVGDGESPALQDDVLKSYGMNVVSHTLTEVVRQADSSGILWNATQLRKLMDTENIFSLPKIRFKGFPDVINISGNELIEVLEERYNRDGEDETIVVTRSNKRANIYNNGIRSQIMWKEEILEGKDMLMVAKNNYYWTEKIEKENIENAKAEGKKTEEAEAVPFDFIANGDTCVVRRVRHERQFYGFTFADAEIVFPDYDNYSMEVTVLLDTLQAEAPALTKEQQDTLFNNIMEDYSFDPDLKTKTDKLKALKQDPYYNALQIKYAYAITCHKAQGGQWTNVFIDQGYMTEDMLGPDYFRWLYTAITRATKRVYFVNWSEEQMMN
ncbi:MAG: AAA family ATPase [Prevotellaceae bacterium]|nr:AAA family ATPase [Candidatus Minthosoma equi]